MSQHFFVLQPAPHPSRKNCWEAIKCMVVMSLSSRDVGRREWSDWREFLYSTLARFEGEAEEGAA